MFEKIIKNGKYYKPALLPDDISRGKLGHCFDNCAARAIRSKYKYVEGFAQDPISKAWILHAWLTDGHHAFDPTFSAFNNEGEEKPFPTIYIGIELDLQGVVDFMLKTGYAGVMANAWRDPELAKKAGVIL